MGDQTSWATQEPHCALADVSPLIKDDEDIIGTFALGIGLDAREHDLPIGSLA
jgi:hypothetical protein